MKNKIDKKMIQAIANNAVREAQKKSLKNGVANVYSKNGQIYFQLPDNRVYYPHWERRHYKRLLLEGQLQ